MCFVCFCVELKKPGKRLLHLLVICKCRRQQQLLLVETEEEAEVYLRQTKPTSTTTATTIERMTTTRTLRRQWTEEAHPSATDISRRWPQLGDVQQCVSIYM